MNKINEIYILASKTHSLDEPSATSLLIWKGVNTEKKAEHGFNDL